MYILYFLFFYIYLFHEREGSQGNLRFPDLFFFIKIKNTGGTLQNLNNEKYNKICRRFFKMDKNKCPKSNLRKTNLQKHR